MSWRAWSRWEATSPLVWLRTETTASAASSATAPTPTRVNAANSRHPSGPSSRPRDFPILPGNAAGRACR